jgi:hypothetical protein
MTPYTMSTMRCCEVFGTNIGILTESERIWRECMRFNLEITFCTERYLLIRLAETRTFSNSILATCHVQSQLSRRSSSRFPAITNSRHKIFKSQSLVVAHRNHSADLLTFCVDRFFLTSILYCTNTEHFLRATMRVRIYHLDICNSSIDAA